MLLGRVNGNPVFRAHDEVLVLARKDCIDVVGNQRAVVRTILVDELLRVEVVYKQSGSAGADIQAPVFSLV